MNYPKQFIENVLNTWGKKGEDWLNTLPLLIQNSIKKWKLTNLTIPKNLSYNFIVFAETDRKNFSELGGVIEQSNFEINGPLKVALKLAIPSPEIEREIKALKFFEGQGVSKLYDFDLEKGTILLARIFPGNSLKELFPRKENDATSIYVEVIKKLHAKGSVGLGYNFPTINQWLAGLNTNHPEIPVHHIKTARELSEYLLATQGEPVLLHGDLHHDNILQSTNSFNGWVSIDPKGVIGESCYEVGAFIRNPMPELIKTPNMDAIIKHRFEAFSTQLKINPSRLKQWSFVQSILAACWCCEDNNPNWNDWIICAESIMKQI